MVIWSYNRFHARFLQRIIDVIFMSTDLLLAGDFRIRMKKDKRLF